MIPNEPAFPFDNRPSDDPFYSGGLTKRDYIAAQFTAAFIAYGYWEQDVCKRSYKLADAQIKESNKNNKA